MYEKVKYNNRKRICVSFARVHFSRLYIIGFDSVCTFPLILLSFSLHLAGSLVPFTLIHVLPYFLSFCECDYISLARLKRTLIFEKKKRLEHANIL